MDSLKNLMGYLDADKYEALAQVSEAAERYEDMVFIMSTLVDENLENQKALTADQRNLLSVAYKNVVGAKRSSWRVLNETSDGQGDLDTDLAKEYKKQVENELESVCKEVLGKLGKLQEQNAKRLKDNTDADKDTTLAESQVFYLKMIGDYYRYLTEAFSDKEEYKKKCDEHYGQAQTLAQAKLAATHPTRLGLALNYSVCYYEILKETKKAVDVAKKAFDEAIEKLDSLNDNSYKDSTLIMQLLRDNLTIWESDRNDQEEQ